MDKKIKLNVRYTKLEDAVFLQQWLEDADIAEWFPMDETQHNINLAVDYWIGHSKLNSSLTVEIDAIPCGMATLLLQPYAKVKHQSELAIIVNKQWRGRGVGTILLKNLEMLAQKKFNIEYLHLQVYAGNPAVTLYERLGFEKFGQCNYWLKEKTGRYRGCVFMGSKIPLKNSYNQLADGFVVVNNLF